MRDYIQLVINNQPHQICAPEAFMMLADYLRSMPHLCGTKIVCAEGDCGACTVLCCRPKDSEEDSGYMPINACIALVAELDGAHILTVESLKEQNLLSPVQEAMVKAHGSQCGFCTPGFIMTMTALAQKAKNKQTLNEQTIKNALTGNLCRCTGYDTIIDAAKNINLNIFNSLYEKYPVKTNNSPENILINHNNYQFHAPSNIKQALNWLQENSQATILGSVTDLGVLANKNQKPLNNILSLQNIPELYLITRDQQNITIGARVSLSSLRKFIQNLIPELARFLNIFASPQIKNMATLIGNIANASPIADMPPFLLVTQAELSLVSSSNKRKVILENFYLAYKKIDLQPGEIITHISFKIPSAQEYLRLYKISQRKDLDISTVNAAFCCELDTTQDFPIITKARIAFGGVADRSIRLMQTENFLKNQKLSPNLISQAKIISQNEIKPLDDLRGSANYRRVLVNAIIDRYFQEIMGKGRT